MVAHNKRKQNAAWRRTYKAKRKAHKKPVVVHILRKAKQKTEAWAKQGGTGQRRWRGGGWVGDDPTKKSGKYKCKEDSKRN